MFKLKVNKNLLKKILASALSVALTWNILVAPILSFSTGKEIPSIPVSEILTTLMVII